MSEAENLPFMVFMCYAVQKSFSPQLFQDRIKGGLNLLGGNRTGKHDLQKIAYIENMLILPCQNDVSLMDSSCHLYCSQNAHLLGGLP